MATIVQKSQLVSLQVPVAQLGQQRFNFVDQPQLRSELKGKTVYIDGIEAYNSDDMSINNFGQALITPAIMKTAYLTLFIGDAKVRGNMGEYVNFMPLVSIHRVQAGTNPFVRELVMFPGQTVDWSKSYVTVGTPIGGATAYSFMFNVYYHFGDQLKP